MTAIELAIQVRGLSKEFGNRGVLRQIDLDIAVGESLALTGVNGAGKTTLLRCLAGLVRPNAGEVRCWGQPVQGNPAVRRWIGMVAHEQRLYPHLTLRENLIFAARMCRVAEPGRQADESLLRVGLSAYASYLPTQASKGMRQRIAVARALIHAPRILLLDEPFAGLDKQGSRWLLELLLELRAAGRTICFSTHDEAQTHSLAERVLEIQGGRLLERTPADDAPPIAGRIGPRAA